MLILKMKIVKSFRNEDFMYQEYVVMQPLQRSYAITEERIQSMFPAGSLSSLYDEAKVNELEECRRVDWKGRKESEKLSKIKSLYMMLL